MSVHDAAGRRSSNPYGDAANLYYSAGWRGVLPLPPGQKYPPPHGYTGAGGKWPSGADVWAWSEDHAHGNVGLRLPADVIGLDVDAYDDKQGENTMRAALDRWGTLPDTYRSTSRDDGRSGIYLYRVPPGLWWPGEVGPGVEVIQTRHRYAVAPPSVHPSGRRYEWHDTHGRPLAGGTVPALYDLPHLPVRWVEGLTAGRLAVDIAKADVDDAAHAAWIGAPKHVGAPCGIVRVALQRALTELRSPAGSRHDTTLRVVMHLARLGTEGHTGCGVALDTLCTAFFDAVSPDRGVEAATAEWQRLYAGALSVIAADGHLTPCDLPDPCAHPMAGLIMPADLHAAPDTRAVSPYSGGGEFGQARPPADDLESLADAFAVEVAREAHRLAVKQAARRQVDADEQARQWPGYPPTYDLRTLLALDEPEPVWTVEGLLPEGGNVVVIAAAKAGKTTTVNDVVRSLVDGRPVFGRYAVNFAAGTCHLWNYEVGRSMYRAWLREVGIENDDRVHVMNLRGHRVPLSVEQVKRGAVEGLQNTDARVWVLDPFARALIGNALSENDNSEVSAFLDVLDEIKAAAGVEHLIIPTHASRMDTTPGAERSRGASRLEDWADVRWYLSRDSEGGRFFRASGRDVETEEEQLVMDTLTRRLVLQPGERATPAEGPGRKKKVTDGDIQTAAVALIGDAPGIGVRGLRRAVADRYSVDEKRVDAAVQALASQGVVVFREGRNRMREHYLPAQLMS